MRRFYSALCVLALLATEASAAEPADWVIRAKYVVTMDAAHRLIDHGAVAIRGARIVGVGTQSAIANRFQAKQTLDKPEGLIAPGLIDTHTHAPMSLFRAIADDMRLQQWLDDFIFPAESKNVSPDFVRWGTRLACLEMVLAGITTYTDMYYFEDVEAEAAKEAGVRGVLGADYHRLPLPRITKRGRRRSPLPNTTSSGFATTISSCPRSRRMRFIPPRTRRWSLPISWP